MCRSVVALIRLEIAALEQGPGKQPLSDRRQSKTRLASNGQKNWINCCECVVDATLGNVYASYHSEVAIVGAFRWQAAQRKKLAWVWLPVGAGPRETFFGQAFLSRCVRAHQDLFRLRVQSQHWELCARSQCYAVHFSVRLSFFVIV